MNKSPLAIVKEKFGEKSKLIAALSEFTNNDLWVDRVNKNKTLERVANAKLLRLHRIFSEVKEKFGSRAKLIDAICEMEKRSGDPGFRKRLESRPVPRLYDVYQAVARRTRLARPKTDAAAAASAGKKGQKSATTRPATGAKAVSTAKSK
jgi:hypothetical protein